jgi:hypothetical protein
MNDLQIISKWRRFELLDTSKENKLLELIQAKNLSKEDLIFILETIKLREFN